jgi:hypothetical protein
MWRDHHSDAGTTSRGAATSPNYPPNYNRGTKRLSQILILESAHLIWVLRCERTHTGPEIQALWPQAINFRLSEDKVTAARIIRDESYTAMIANTWEPILSRDSILLNPRNWIHNSEVLVGIGHLCPQPIGAQTP